MSAGTNGQYFLYCANAMMSRRIPNSLTKSTEFVDLPELMALSFTVEKSRVEVKSGMCETLGQVKAVNSRITSVNCTLAVHVKHAEAIRAALSGIATELTGTADAVTAESVTFPDTADVWVELDHKRVLASPGPAIVGSTLGTDYDIRWASGKIKALSGGNLIGQTVDMDYSYAAESGSEQDIGNLSQVEWAIHAELSDQYEPGADKVLCEIDAITIDPDGAVKVVIDTPDDQEHSVMTFTGSCRLLPGETASARLNGTPVQVYDWPTA